IGRGAETPPPTRNAPPPVPPPFPGPKPGPCPVPIPPPLPVPIPPPNPVPFDGGWSIVESGLPIGDVAGTVSAGGPTIVGSAESFGRSLRTTMEIGRAHVRTPVT